MNKGLSIEWQCEIGKGLDLDQVNCNVLTRLWTIKFVKKAIKYGEIANFKGLKTLNSVFSLEGPNEGNHPPN
jgi:hypothetical protein